MKKYLGYLGSIAGVFVMVAFLMLVYELGKSDGESDTCHKCYDKGFDFGVYAQKHNDSFLLKKH